MGRCWHRTPHVPAAALSMKPPGSRAEYTRVQRFSVVYATFSVLTLRVSRPSAAGASGRRRTLIVHGRTPWSVTSAYSGYSERACRMPSRTQRLPASIVRRSVISTVPTRQ